MVGHLPLGRSPSLSPTGTNRCTRPRACFTHTEHVLTDPHKRALVAGGTGRVGDAIAGRLRAEAGRSSPPAVPTATCAPATARQRLVAQARCASSAGSTSSCTARCRLHAEPVDDVTEEDWDAALDVTAKGTFFLAQAARPALRESKGVLVIVEDVASFQPWTPSRPH